MIGKIFRSIFIVAMCILVACFGLFLGVLYEYFTGTQEAQLETSLLLSARGVEENGRSYFDGLKDDCRLTWVDSDGTVLYDSESDTVQMENHAQREEVQEALQTGNGDSVRYSTTLMQKTIYRALRLSDGTVLRISVSQATVLFLVIGMLQPIAIILAIALVLSIVLAYKLSEKIMQPLLELDLDHLPVKAPYEELSPLLKKIRWQKSVLQKQEKELADKRLNMEFAEQNRREFTANVSHELKTPLQSIMGSAELIENQLVKPEDLPRFAGNIRKESNRLLALIEDIIHLSRLDEGVGLKMESVDLFQIAQEEMDLLEAKAEEQKITLNIVGSSVVFPSNPQLLREILYNLCDNAVKYNHPGGRVTVHIAQTEQKVLLAVSDTGIGIPEEYQDHVFERFYRVDKSRSKATGGTGLGLSIVKHAAAYLGGSITLESAVGVGTTITLTFPKA